MTVRQDIIAPIREGEKITGIIGVNIDITEQHRLAAEMHYQARHDALTGLVNRREFEQRLQRVINTTRQDTSQHVLCYLDLDQFKVVNDTCGHTAGDDLLRQIGQLFAARIRKHDTLARLGGDEFGLLLEHCGLEQKNQELRHKNEEISCFYHTLSHELKTPLTAAREVRGDPARRAGRTSQRYPV